MKKVHLINQHDEKDCGAACLSMILTYYGKKMPMAAIREAIQVDQYGASIYGLLDGAEKYDLEANTIKGDADAVIKAVIEKRIPLPAIIRIVNKEHFEHFVLITGANKKKVFICDPGKGKYHLSVDNFRKCYLGHVVTFTPNKKFKKEKQRKGNFKCFLQMILRQKTLIASIGLLSLLVTGIGLIGTYLFQYLIDTALPSMEGEHHLSEGLELFAVMIFYVGILYLFKFLVQFLRGKLVTLMSKRIDLPLMLGYYDHVADLPMRFFDTRKTGEILSRFQDAAKIREAISGVTLTLMIDVVLVIICGCTLYKQSPALFSIAFSIFLLYLLTIVIFVKPLKKFNRDIMEENSQFNSYLTETITGMETVKSAQAENTVKSKIAYLFQNYINKNAKGSMLTISKDAIIDLIGSFGILALLWAGAISVSFGMMTLGSFIAFYSLMSYFLTPIQNLVELQSNLQTAFVSIERLNDILELKTENHNSSDNSDDIENIRFDDVSFRYGNRNLILDKVSFHIEKGQQIALVGESGCGKSTITKLLMGFYQPNEGKVLINNKKSIDEVSLHWIRSKTAYVPQNTFLFADTIRNNLILGLPEDKIPTDEVLYKLLDSCCCSFIKNMPFGLDSMLEENGCNLSGGQKQRLAIVRALLRNPNVLILDEATSNLDAITEYEIQKTLKTLYPNIITVIVAHRLSTIKSSDQILAIEKGKIIEFGKHSELLEKNGYYSSLWKKQQLCTP